MNIKHDQKKIALNNFQDGNKNKAKGKTKKTVTRKQARQLPLKNKKVHKQRYYQESQITKLQKTFRKHLTMKKYTQSHLRYQLIKEITESEQKYNLHLQFIVNLKRELKEKNLIDEESIRIIFLGVEEIYLFSNSMARDLKRILRHWHIDSFFGKFFSEMIPYMKIYTPYINNYGNAAQVLITNKNKNKKFKRYTKRIPQQQESERLNLESLIIKPVQRIAQYTLFYDRIEKLSRGENKEFVSRISITLKEMATLINEKKREFENRIKIVEINQKIINSPDESLITPRRVFITQFKADFLIDNKARESILFLFNDILIVCEIIIMKKNKKKTNKPKVSYKLSYSWKLSKMKFNNKSVQIVSNQIFWKLHHRAITFSFVTNKEKKVNNLESTKHFLKTLVKAIKNEKLKHCEKKNTRKKLFDEFKQGKSKIKIQLNQQTFFNAREQIKQILQKSQKNILLKLQNPQKQKRITSHTSIQNLLNNNQSSTQEIDLISFFGEEM
ncbi:faciogenital dysplasia protein [Anaeramoeba flamelloides]|uniref:Faciogenital dysplasia protein n=1 Tax=Anaeramoeba flamelloides TaxID=1746091 RepID=A0AAV7YQM4_9EUKA|nr:faciogenital dysplasia protein [Anaeramoeba flamelloides]